MPHFPEISCVVFLKSIGPESQHHGDRGLYDYSLSQRRRNFRLQFNSSSCPFAKSCARVKDNRSTLAEQHCGPAGDTNHAS